MATGLEKVSFHSNPKERQCQRMFRLPNNCTHLHASKEMLNTLKFRLQQCVKQELSKVQLAFRKSRGTRGQITNICWITEKQENSRKTSQFSSVSQSCPTLCDPMNRSTPGLPVHHQLLEFTQTHAHQIGDAIQPSHPLSSPSPPAPNPFQHQGLFHWVNSLHEVAKLLKFQLQHQSFQRTPRTDLL